MLKVCDGLAVRGAAIGVMLLDREAAWRQYQHRSGRRGRTLKTAVFVGTGIACGLLMLTSRYAGRTTLSWPSSLVNPECTREAAKPATVAIPNATR